MTNQIRSANAVAEAAPIIPKRGINRMFKATLRLAEVMAQRRSRAWCPVARRESMYTQRRTTSAADQSRILNGAAEFSYAAPYKKRITGSARNVPAHNNGTTKTRHNTTVIRYGR